MGVGGWGVGGEKVYKENETNSPFFFFFTIRSKRHKFLLCVFFSENYRLCIWTLKTEDDPFIKKNENRKKSSIQEGKAYVVEMEGGRTKKISPKDAMHLVVVL